jgi:hypothetical protein
LDRRRSKADLLSGLHLRTEGCGKSHLAAATVAAASRTTTTRSSHTADAFHGISFTASMKVRAFWPNSGSRC